MALVIEREILRENREEPSEEDSSFIDFSSPNIPQLYTIITKLDI